MGNIHVGHNGGKYGPEISVNFHLHGVEKAIKLAKK